MVSAWPAYNSRNWDVDLKGYIDQIAVSVATFATPGQIAGTEDATSAWQTAGEHLYQVSGGRGGRLLGIGGQWWFDGSGMVMLTPQPGATTHRWDHVTIDLAGCRIFKTTQDGNYVVFLDRYGSLGYGGGVNDLTIENGYIQGSFSDSSPASLNLFCGNHSKDVRIRNCVFRETNLQGAHTFELDACDTVLIEDCTWYGYKPNGTDAPRTEAINTDASVVGAGAAVAGYADGLQCRNITVNRCRFLPWTSGSGTVYPSPPILGTHGAVEGRRPENIVATGIVSVDPPVDNASTGVAGDNAYMRGLIHYPGVKGLTVQMKVVATNGTGSIRCVQVASQSSGVLASSNWDSPTSGDFAAYNLAEDINLDVQVSGMAGTGTALNPAIYVGGCTTIAGVAVAGGDARNIDIRADTDGVSKEAVYLWHVQKATVRFPRCKSSTSGVRCEYGTNVSVSGKFENVQIPVRFRSSSKYCSAPDVHAINTTGTNYAYLVEAPSGTDYVSLGTVLAQGYTALWSTTAPTNSAKGAVVGVA